MTHDETLLARLGLDSALGEPIGEIRPLPDDTARGDAQGGAAALLPEPIGEGVHPRILELVRANLKYQDDQDEAGRRSGLRGAGYWVEDPRVLLVEGVDEVIAADGGVDTVGPGDFARVLAFDVRTSGAARIRSGARELVLLVEDEVLRFYSPGVANDNDIVPKPPALDADCFGDPEPEGTPFPVPPIGDLLENWSVAPWLAARANTWAVAPVAMLRAAAVGLIGRLADAETTDPAAALAARLGGDDGPAGRARAWARSLGEGPLRLAVASLLGEASRLIEDIETLIDVLVDLTERAPDLALSIRERRDELECAAFVVRASDVGAPELREAVDDALAEVDRTAAEQSGVLVDAGLPESGTPRWLRAVGWQEPGSWWGDRP